ncbi:MAG: hypothetical protein A3J38_10430 [Gammaproteobacteria bacterium RIFCSPHIGHO2_12_FULL_45_9]|nr:MAG: hypothetical protein A3J38_10430 [Gammaproteobacteria bacterium RIFCSPHIGHO2_12_FULL_45_9]
MSAVASRKIPLPKRPQHLKQLEEYLTTPTPLVLVLGAPGCGKSALIQDLIAQIQVNVRIIRLQGDPDLQPASLAQTLANHFDLLSVQAQGGAYRQQLDQMLIQLREQDTSVVLIVDDAQILPVAALAALSHLAIKQEGELIRLRVFLVGELELEEKVKTLQARLPPRVVVNPLTRKETYVYIRYCLTKLNHGIAFSPAQEVVDRIFQQSAGIPTAIAHATQEWLEEHVHDERFGVAEDPVQAAATLMAKTEVERDIDQHMMVDPETRSWGTPRTTMRRDPLDDMMDVSDLTEDASIMRTPRLGINKLKACVGIGVCVLAIGFWAWSHTERTASPAVGESHALVLAPTNDFSVSAAPVSTALTETSTSVASLQTAPAPVIAPVPVATEASEPVALTPVASVVPAPSAAPAVPPQTTAPVLSQSVEFGVMPGGADPEAIVKAQAAVVAAPPAVKMKPMVTKPMIAPAAKIAMLKPRGALPKVTGYTLQFFASHDRVHAVRFMNRHQLQGIATLTTVHRDGQVWYIVRCGNYPSRDAALLALDQMAIAVQALQPWAKAVDG